MLYPVTLPTPEILNGKKSRLGLIACSQKISPSALVVELGRHAGNDYHQFHFAAIFSQVID